MKCKFCGLEMIKVSSGPSTQENSSWCINCGTLLIEEKDVEKWFNPQHKFDFGKGPSKH